MGIPNHDLDLSCIYSYNPIIQLGFRNSAMWSTLDLCIYFHNLLDLGSMMMTFKIVINLTTRQGLFKYHLNYYLGSKLWPSSLWIPPIPGFSYSHNVSFNEFNFFLHHYLFHSAIFKICYFQFFPLYYSLNPYFLHSLYHAPIFSQFFHDICLFPFSSVIIFLLMFPLLLRFSVVLSFRFPILCFIVVVHLWLGTNQPHHSGLGYLTLSGFL